MKYNSPLHAMSETTPTDYWNDSCAAAELEYAISHGAVGATTNPVIVLDVLKQELSQWEAKIRTLIANNPEATEDDITWRFIEHIATERAAYFNDIFARSRGLKGRLSIQTNPKYYNNSARLIEQTMHFATLFDNINVKIPATKAGIVAIEEVTTRGISVNATVSFTVPQAIAVAEAIERGLERRQSAGENISQMAPVCTIMVGRVDDWMRAIVAREQMAIDPEWLDWAGVAVGKQAYRIYRTRGYRVRLLMAAFRNHYHWSQFVGGDMVLSMPGSWARRFNGSDITAQERIEHPVNRRYVEGLRSHIADFAQAYDEEGMTIAEFDDYGATRRTLRQFLLGYSDLVALIRDYMVVDPDLP